MMVTEAPVPVMVMPVPVPSDADALILIPVDVFKVEGDIWKVTDARPPSAIGVVLKPATMQRTSPADGVLQLADLPAADAAPPVDQNVPEAGLRSPAL